MKIVVVGLGKSGTTALCFKILAGMPRDTRLLFEARAYEPGLVPSDHVLAKVLIGFNRPMDSDSFRAFDRKLLLLRDPRDTLVSRVLYDVYNEPAIWSDDACVAALMAVLRRKEADPRSVPLRELIDVFDRMARRAMLPRAVEGPRVALEFQRDHPEYWCYRYEDLIRCQFAALESFLGFALGRDPAAVPPEFGRVSRHKSAGDWRHWLTPSDIDFFRPHFAKYLDVNHYGDDWALSERPFIAPDHSSEYLLRLVNERRQMSAAT